MECQELNFIIYLLGLGKSFCGLTSDKSTIRHFQIYPHTPQILEKSLIKRLYTPIESIDKTALIT